MKAKRLFLRSCSRKAERGEVGVGSGSELAVQTRWLGLRRGVLHGGKRDERSVDEKGKRRRERGEVGITKAEGLLKRRGSIVTAMGRRKTWWTWDERIEVLYSGDNIMGSQNVKRTACFIVFVHV